MSIELSQITLGGGCFWCLEAVFQRVKGVSQVISGYAGGHSATPDYKSVCAGTTGHAEVIQIHYDANMVVLAQLLAIFFTVHDPTTLNRQGNDVGTQYRSIVFYSNEAEKAEIKTALTEAQNDWKDPIVTQVKALERFFSAEDYHQNYFNSNPGQPYCSLVVAPKVRKFEEKFAELIA